MFDTAWKRFTEILYAGVMILGWIAFLTVIFTRECRAEQIRIAIIDSGYSSDLAKAVGAPPLKQCKTGHYDFTKKTPGIGFGGPHGTHIASIIAATLENVDYCAIVYTVFDTRGENAGEYIVQAFERAQGEQLTVVNASFTGIRHSYQERNAIQKLTKNTMIFVAAGNDNRDLDTSCVAFPACYNVKNLVMVGALSYDQTQKAQYSNYGSKVQLWYPGSLDSPVGYIEGTSIATPRALSDYVLSLVRKK